MSRKNKHRDRETGGGVATEVGEHPSDRHKETAAAASYPDTHPLDQIQYLEARLILKSDRFTSVESFRYFGKLVKRTAKDLKVGFTDDPEAGRRPEIREIIFVDTRDCRLYNNAFILRRRISFRFARKEDVHRKARELAEQFFVSQQQDVKEWISLGTTKTGMVYRLKGNAPQSHE